MLPAEQIERLHQSPDPEKPIEAVVDIEHRGDRATNALFLQTRRTRLGFGATIGLAGSAEPAKIASPRAIRFGKPVTRRLAARVDIVDHHSQQAEQDFEVVCPALNCFIELRRDCHRRSSIGGISTLPDPGPADLVRRLSSPSAVLQATSGASATSVPCRNIGRV